MRTGRAGDRDVGRQPEAGRAAAVWLRRKIGAVGLENRVCHVIGTHRGGTLPEKQRSSGGEFRRRIFMRCPPASVRGRDKGTELGVAPWCRSRIVGIASDSGR